MFERRSALLGAISRLVDLVLTALSFPVAYWVRMHVLTRMVGSDVVQPAIYPFGMYWSLFAGILVLWFLIGHFVCIYRDIELRTRQQLIGDAAKLIILGVVALNAALYFVRADYISRAFILTIAAVDFMLLVAGRIALLGGSRRLRERLQRFHYCLIVGLGQNARELASLIEQSEPMGLRLIGFVNPGVESESRIGGLKSQYPIFALADAYGILQNHVVDELLFAVNNDELESLEPLIDRCHKEGIRTRVDLGFFPRTFARVHLENLRHVPLLTLGSTPNNEFALFAKRVADIVVSALALIVLSPLMLALAILVRLTSPGPILYRQTRCGLNVRRFTLYKFRSMVANADKLRAELDGLNEVEGPAFKMKNDPRCTPLGRWLRKFSLDELPQLWNVLIGEMSFVGPRPPLPQEVERYAPWQRRRLRMRPGLTCLWTLEGRSRLSFDRLVQFDLAYIDNWSLWLDLKIFLKTIPHVALGRGAS
ncbi:MAG: sugar transferase [Acidobacteria bacterium]|nr:MAG: sugar transferase [Acidobacteriota bacterium]